MTRGLVQARARTVQIVSCPALWPVWPFLPVVRRAGGREELGVVFDARHVCGLMGFSAAVVLCNLYCLPATLGEFLALPREVFDSAEELADAQWQVD